jgi:phage-related tail protein
MPMFFGRLDLDDDQRTKVQEIQHSYQTQADELNKQLETLKAERDEQLLEVLREPQREKLNEMTLALQASRTRQNREADVPERPTDGGDEDSASTGGRTKAKRR